MISHELKYIIEKKADEIINENKFFIFAGEGKITKNHIMHLLHNYAYALQTTSKHLKLCIKLSNNKELSLLFSEKHKEELGHDMWAFNDIKALGSPADKINKNFLTPTILDLMKYLEFLIKTDVRYYIIYMLTAEYSLILLGPILLDRLKKLDPTASDFLSVLYKHIELDQYHAADGLKAADHYFFKKEYSEIKNISKTCLDYIDQFYENLASVMLQEDLK
ncbi:MAG: hypothetical protein WC748_05105 [Legionellales bacterium]|jgi:hypothetical protein